MRVGRVRRQRGDGRRGRHAAPVGARQGARRGAAGLREHARPRAGRLLPRARLAEGRLRAARGRDGDPDRLRARHPRPDRPRRHEGVRLRRLRQGQLQGDPDPRRSRRARAGVPREAHGRGRRELRVADGALPRGRGDLPRGDRVRARGRHRPRPHLPRDLRRGDRAPRRRPAAGGDRRRPPVARPARRARARGHDARADRGRRDVRLRVQDAGRPVRGAHQPVPRLPGRHDPRHAGAQHPHPPQGADRAAARPARQGGLARRLVRAGRHRRGGQAQGDAGGRLAGRARPADLDALDQAAGAGDGVRDGADRATRTRPTRRCAACRRRTRRSTCTATRRPASRSSRASRRSTSR